MALPFAVAAVWLLPRRWRLLQQRFLSDLPLCWYDERAGYIGMHLEPGATPDFVKAHASLAMRPRRAPLCFARIGTSARPWCADRIGSCQSRSCIATPHCVATGGSSFRLGESPASASCPKPLSAELPPRAQSVGPFPGDRKSLAALSRGTHRADLKAIRDSVHPAKQPPQPDLLWDTISSHQCRNQPRRRRKPHALSPMTTATIGWRPLPAAEFEVHQLARSSPMESNLRTA